MKQSKLIDTSLELFLCPYKNGVQLIRPEQKNKNIFFYSLKYFFASSMQVYLYDNGSRFQTINEECLKCYQLSSEKEIAGRTPKFICEDEYSKILIRNNQKVLSANCMKIFEENTFFKSNVFESIITFKFPLYKEDSIAGIFGCSIVIGKSDIPTELIFLLQSKLLTAFSITKAFELKTLSNRKEMDIYLTFRERECLIYLIKGMSAKQTAKTLALSPRTVEHYLESIKVKFNCKSRFELIEKGLKIEYIKNDLWERLS